MFQILLLIPAQFLHHVVRYVCKQWYDIVNDPLFAATHFQLSSSSSSSSGFLFFHHHETLDVLYIEADSLGLQSTKFPLPFPAKIWGCINGFVLLQETANPRVFHLTNLLTKSIISLPPLVAPNNNLSAACFAIDSSAHYKVVHVTTDDLRTRAHMSVFTLGVDKVWRSIDLEGLIPMDPCVRRFLVHRPRFIAGFIYWKVEKKRLVGLAMDADTETIYPLWDPDFKGPDYTCGLFLLTMGTCAGLLRSNMGFWPIWKLTDVKVSEWTRLAPGLCGKQLFSNKKLCPRYVRAFHPHMFMDEYFWFEYRLEKDTHLTMVRYNLADDSFASCPTGKYRQDMLQPYIHTLLSPKNCLL